MKNELPTLEVTKVLARLAIHQYSRIARNPQAYLWGNKTQVLTEAADGFTYPDGYTSQGWYRALYALGFDAWCGIDHVMRNVAPIKPAPVYCYRCPIVESLAGLSHAELMARHKPNTEPVLWCHRNESSPNSQLHTAAAKGDADTVQKNVALLRHAAENLLANLEKGKCHA